MANPALAILETALRTRKLDRTLTTAWPLLERFDTADSEERRQGVPADSEERRQGVPADSEERRQGVPADRVATGVATLDGCLGGGLPRGQVSEVAAASTAGVSGAVRSAGRTTLLLQMFAAATRRGELVALVDAGDGLDVASAVASGIDLDRLLWIRGTAVAGSAIAVDRIVDRALKALSLVLQAGGFGVVAIDLADIPLPMLKRLPFTTWLRVQRMVESSETACLLVVPGPLARSAGGLTLSLTGRPLWVGTADRSQRLTGLEVHVDVVSPRRRVSGAVDVEAVVTDGLLSRTHGGTEACLHASVCRCS